MVSEVVKRRYHLRVISFDWVVFFKRPQRKRLRGRAQSLRATDLKVDPGLVSQKLARTLKTLKRFPLTSDISQNKDRYR